MKAEGEHMPGSEGLREGGGCRALKAAPQLAG